MKNSTDEIETNSKLFYEVKPNKMPITIYEKMDNFIVYEILPNNLKPQLITGISVFVKSLVLSLIIYFNGRQKKKATQ